MLHVGSAPITFDHLEALTDRGPIPNRLSTGVHNHGKLNLNNLFANSRNAAHHGCEFVIVPLSSPQSKAGVAFAPNDEGCEVIGGDPDQSDEGRR